MYPIMYQVRIRRILTFEPSVVTLLGAPRFECIQGVVIADLGWLQALVHLLYQLSLFFVRERGVLATALLPLESVRHIEHLLSPQCIGALHCTEEDWAVLVEVAPLVLPGTRLVPPLVQPL